MITAKIQFYFSDIFLLGYTFYKFVKKIKKRINIPYSPFI